MPALANSADWAAIPRDQRFGMPPPREAEADEFQAAFFAAPADAPVADRPTEPEPQPEPAVAFVTEVGHPPKTEDAAPAFECVTVDYRDPSADDECDPVRVVAERPAEEWLVEVPPVMVGIGEAVKIVRPMVEADDEPAAVEPDWAVYPEGVRFGGSFGGEYAVFAGRMVLDEPMTAAVAERMEFPAERPLTIWPVQKQQSRLYGSDTVAKLRALFDAAPETPLR